MPALMPTDHYGTIVWLGEVPERTTPEIHARAAGSEMHLTFAGAEGEVHAGLTRESCARVTSQYPKGTEIRNVRQVSLVSSEELSEIAGKLDLDELDPTWLGASVVIEGIPDFSHVPPSSRLQADSGATLTVDMQNRPCTLVSKTVEMARPGHGKAFKPAAQGLRGVTAWVEREGSIRIGDRLRLHVPDQRAWQPRR